MNDMAAVVERLREWTVPLGIACTVMGLCFAALAHLPRHLPPLTRPHRGIGTAAIAFAHGCLVVTTLSDPDWWPPTWFVATILIAYAGSIASDWRRRVAGRGTPLGLRLSTVAAALFLGGWALFASGNVPAAATLYLSGVGVSVFAGVMGLAAPTDAPSES